jgi:RNA polymerase sigma factor (sigma-70 family)
MNGTRRKKPVKKKPAAARPEAVAGPVGKVAQDSHDRLTGLVERNYAALRAIADREIAARNLARSVTPTSLVAEAVVRLMRQRQVPQTAPHLCGLSTILMGQALADRLRKTRARKRNGGRKPLPLPEDLQQDRRSSLRIPQDPKAAVVRERLLEALQRLAISHPREMEVLTLRLVLEMPMEKSAKLVGISIRTAYRDLNEGLLLLKRHIGWDRD